MTTKSLDPRRKPSILSIIILSTFLLIIVLLIRQAYSSCVAEADVSVPRRYISIQVEEGDTLWSIAIAHKSQATDISHYIQEIQALNDMTNEDLIASQYLVIPVE